MSGGEGKSDKGCAGAFWDGLDIKKLCCKNWSCKGGNIMLAFNENGKLTEYEETNFLKVCDSCHHIYKQRVEQQLEGMREREYNISNANVIVLQYVISHFYNTGQIGEIESFFEKLVQNIILHKERGKPLVVLINDVNSNNRGRDYFEKLVKKLDGEGLIENSQGYYFDYNIRNEFQRYGIKHESNRIVYNIPDRLSTYQPWEVCSSAQLLIEVL